MIAVGQPGTLPPLGLLGRLLLRLSLAQRASEDRNPDPDAAVRQLEAIVPGIVGLMRRARVLDFGCGSGALAVGLARAGCDVVGLDIQQGLLQRGRSLAGSTHVLFTDRLGRREFDWIISVNSMEHFSEPLVALRQMRAALAPDGRVVITFCPTWFAPYGAHMHFFTNVPWVHLLFPERAVLAVRARFVNDGAMRYEDVTGGLNRMTMRRFFRLVPEAGLTVLASRVDSVRGLRVVQVPRLGELFANRVTAMLARTPARGPE